MKIFTALAARTSSLTCILGYRPQLMAFLSLRNKIILYNINCNYYMTVPLRHVKMDSPAFGFICILSKLQSHRGPFGSYISALGHLAGDPLEIPLGQRGSKEHTLRANALLRLKIHMF